MSIKFAERVSCVKVEKRLKETIFVFLCEWSDITASCMGRTERAIYNLQEYINSALKPEEILDLKLKGSFLFDFIGPNKNIKILNDFFVTITRQSKIVNDVEVMKFFTNGSSPTVKEFLNTFKTRASYFFSFEPAISLPLAEYEEIGDWESNEPQIHPVSGTPSNTCSLTSDNVGIPLYSKVKKTTLSTNSLEPDIITSSKAASHKECSESENNEIPSAEIITMPPKPLFKPPSLPGSTYEANPLQNLDRCYSHVRALEDYECHTRGVLSFTKGNVATIITQDAQGWWGIKLGSQIGWVPGEYWETTKGWGTEKMNNPGWFIGSITRDECEAMMKKYAHEGDYVVRQSLNGNLALSVKHDDEMKHFPIKVTEEGKFNIGQHDFGSVNHIISYYRKNVLFYDKHNEEIKLGKPVIIVQEKD